jgi:hypothetical protein
MEPGTDSFQRAHWGIALDACLDWWQDSERRSEVRKRLRELDGINPDDVIMDPDHARARGLTSTVCFPIGKSCAGRLSDQKHSDRSSTGR